MAAMRHPRITAAAISCVLHAGFIGWWFYASLLPVGTYPSSSGHFLWVEYVALASDASILETTLRDPGAIETLIRNEETLQRQDELPAVTVATDARPPSTTQSGDSRMPDRDLMPPPSDNLLEGASANPQAPDADFHAAVRARIEATWIRVTGRPLPGDCSLSLVLQEGGALVSANASGCSLAEPDRNQLEAAALMSQPLPYAGFEAVFTSTLELELRRRAN